MNWIVYALFFVSGACGLIYQVAWSRLLTHVFGSTALAVSTVLASFMAGLALGAWALGRAGDRTRRPLWLYGLFEIGIGASALVSLFLMGRTTPVFLALHDVLGGSGALFGVARFLVALALVIVPTTLMGATLPLLGRFAVAQLERLGRVLGGLYAINTVGAVSGSLLAGFHLIGAWGVHRTIWLAVALNVLVGVVACGLSRALGERAGDGGPGARPEPAPRTPLRARHGLLLAAFAVSGFTSFGYEILWTRSLIVPLGNSTYAFVLILTGFLAGIALGGWLVRFVADRLARPLRTFAWIQLLIGASAAAAMPLVFRYGLVETSANTTWLFLARFGPPIGFVLVPAVLIGATLPLVGRICIESLERTAEDVGRVYAVNTLGNIAGALLTGFVVLPLLGIDRGIALMVALNLTLGAVLWLSDTRVGGRAAVAAPLAFAAAWLLLVRLPLDVRYAAPPFEEPGDRILFYEDGVSATTKVYQKRETGQKLMSVDGAMIGGTGITDYKQQVLAHLPKLLAPRFENELSIGLGSGILIGESARHPEVGRIVCVELTPSVVAGAALFEQENRGVLHDERVEVVVDDGVNYLLRSRERFDVISSDAKSRPNFAGNGTFFSEEFYTLLRDHLVPGGVAIQWIPLHLPHEDYRMVLHTFAGVFPEGALWYFPWGETFLVGSNAPIEVDVGRIERALAAEEGPFAGLRRYGLTGAPALLAHRVASVGALATATEGARTNTLEHPYYEFYELADYTIPEGRRMLHNVDLVLTLRRDQGDSWLASLAGAGPRVREAYRAETRYLEAARGVLAEAADLAPVERGFEEALTLAPWNDDLRYHVHDYWAQKGRMHLGRGEPRRAENAFGRAVGLFPADGEARMHLGTLLAQRGERDGALRELEAAVGLAPQRVDARRQLASLYVALGRFDDAAAQFESILAIDPDDVFALVELGRYLAEKHGRHAEALAYVRSAYALEPDNPLVINGLAWVAFLSGDTRTTLEVIEAGGDYYEGIPMLREQRAFMLQRAGAGASH